MWGGGLLPTVTWGQQQLSQVLICCSHQVTLSFVNLLRWEVTKALEDGL